MYPKARPRSVLTGSLAGSLLFFLQFDEPQSPPRMVMLRIQLPPFGHINVDGIEERMIGYVQPPDDNRGRAKVLKSGGRILARSKLVLAR